MLKILTQPIQSNIPCMFDRWADQVVHLLLKESFMD